MSFHRLPFIGKHLGKSMHSPVVLCAVSQKQNEKIWCMLKPTSIFSTIYHMAERVNVNVKGKKPSYHFCHRSTRLMSVMYIFSKILFWSKEEVWDCLLVVLWHGHTVVCLTTLYSILKWISIQHQQWPQRWMFVLVVCLCDITYSLHTVMESSANRPKVWHKSE